MRKGVEVEVEEEEEEEVLVEEEWLERGGQGDDRLAVLLPFRFMLLPAFPLFLPPPSRQPLALPLSLLPDCSLSHPSNASAPWGGREGRKVLVLRRRLMQEGMGGGSQEATTAACWASVKIHG